MADQIGFFATLKNAAGKIFSCGNTLTLNGVDGKTLTIEDDSVVNQDLSSDAGPTFDHIHSHELIGYSSTIADDSVITIPFSGQSCIVIVQTFFGATSGVIFVRPGVPATVSLAKGADLNTTTGILSGITGTDGKVTISCHTNGNIYIENRYGGPVGFGCSIIGGYY